jgi:hypothetical protein
MQMRSLEILEQEKTGQNIAASREKGRKEQLTISSLVSFGRGEKPK